MQNVHRWRKNRSFKPKLFTMNNNERNFLFITFFTNMEQLLFDGSIITATFYYYEFLKRWTSVLITNFCLQAFVFVTAWWCPCRGESAKYSVNQLQSHLNRTILNSINYTQQWIRPRPRHFQSNQGFNSDCWHSQLQAWTSLEKILADQVKPN